MQMDRRSIVTLLILTVLVLGLIFRLPIEFLNRSADRTATIFIALFILVTFIFLQRQAKYIGRKSIKIFFAIIVSILAVPYFFVGLFSVWFVTYKNYPMWEDVAIYSNSGDEKLISQWRETSGSIYDYQTRKIIKDFGSFRISYVINDRHIHGVWTEHLIKKDSTFSVDLDKEKIDYYDYMPD